MTEQQPSQQPEEQQDIVIDQEPVAATPAAHRVKLYQLNMDTNWEDKGTGFCVYQVGVDGQPDQLIVRSEEDNSILLTSNVLKRRLYQRQQDTLIVWTEDDNRDLALSFQDPAGCEEIWQCMGKKQDGSGSKIAGDTDDGGLTPPAGDISEITSLPDPDLTNLKEIADIFNAAHTLQEKDKISTFINIENYFDKILSLFETCEDLEDIKDLNLLYTVMMSLLTLNDQGIIEQLVRDEYIFGFMGILEYSPNTPGMKAKHREFIKLRGNTKPAIEISDETITRKIDQTFRLEYLQGILQSNNDADEGLLGVLNNMIFQNYVEIVNHIQSNHMFLSELLIMIRGSDTTEEKKNDIIRFVQQLCGLTKQMQNSVRVSLYRSLANYGLFDLMRYALVNKDRSIRIASLNILASFTDLDVVSVRSHLLQQAKDDESGETPLIGVIAEQLAADANHELKVQYFEILKLILDLNGNSNGGPTLSDPLSKQAPETEELLQLFYEKYVKTLLAPIENLEIKPISLKGPIEPLHLTQDQAQLCLYLCEFLYFAVRNHGFRSKYVLLSADLFIRITQLYRSKYAYIKLGALRFFRVCIAAGDEFYNRTLVKQNIFEPTIRVLLDTNGRDCLLNSACLDLLDFIRKENVKPLINHLINQFGTVLDTITYISTCKQLRTKYDQNNEANAPNNTKEDESVLSDKTDKKANHNGWASSTVDDEEEDYFNGSDEEDVPATQIPEKESTAVPTPLVNYEGDDDDDDEKEEPKEEQKQENTTEQPSVESKTEATTSSLKRKNTEDENDDTSSEQSKESQEESIESPSSPPPLKSRRTLDEDDEEDDVFAKRSPRQSPSSKKIVIKTSTIKKMRSQ